MFQEDGMVVACITVGIQIESAVIEYAAIGIDFNERNALVFMGLPEHLLQLGAVLIMAARDEGRAAVQQRPHRIDRLINRTRGIRLRLETDRRGRRPSAVDGDRLRRSSILTPSPHLGSQSAER